MAKKKREFQKLSEEQLEKMFMAYVQKPSLLFVAQTCGVSKKTAGLWRQKNNWDERRRIVLQKAVRESNQNTASILAEHVRICSDMRVSLEEQLQALAQNPKRQDTISGLTRAILSVMSFERSLHAESNQHFEIESDLTRRIDTVMAQGGVRAEKIRNLLSDLSDLIAD